MKSFEFAGLVLDLRQARLRKDNVDVPLRRKSFTLLAYLIQNSGRVLSKDELVTAVWPDVIVSDDSLAQCMKDIRNALGVEGRKLIRTVPRRGYIVDESQIRIIRVEPPPVARSASAKASIAVLPFTNMSGGPEQDYFADGITEDIITGLSRFRELLVTARNSAFQFRAGAVNIEEVGRTLQVQFVVKGSVRRTGKWIRVTAQLVDVESAAHIWAERYDRELTDMFEIQDDITLTIVTRVVGRTRTAFLSRMRTRPTGNLSAYDLFLQARECFGSDETASRAEPFLRKAIELDPDFSDAHALLSMMHTIGYMHDIQTYHLHDALASAQRALELDPSGPLANHANGYALMFLHRLDEAGFYLRNAIELNPNEIYFRGEYANWMNYAGDSEGALREIKEALRRDPYANDWFWNVRGNIDTAAGRYTDALASMHRMKSPTPWSYCYRAICHVELGQLAQAQECLERFRLVVTHMTAADFIASRPYAATVSRRMVEALRQVETAINGRNKN